MVGELDEAKRYLELARESKRRGSPYNPAITNCIMAMIRTTDALHLRYRDTVLRDHSKTAKEFQKLYDQNYIPARFKANLDGIHKWVVEEKSRVQYKGHSYSKNDCEQAIKTAERLYKKTKNHLS